jgi:hypothetical protein
MYADAQTSGVWAQCRYTSRMEPTTTILVANAAAVPLLARGIVWLRSALLRWMARE